VGQTKKKDNPGVFVQVEDCRERHGQTVQRVVHVETALFGTDGRGGMVKDIADIKSTLSVATSIVRTIIIPIVVPLILAAIGFIVGKYI